MVKLYTFYTQLKWWHGKRFIATVMCSNMFCCTKDSYQWKHENVGNMAAKKVQLWSGDTLNQSQHQKKALEIVSVVADSCLEWRQQYPFRNQIQIGQEIMFSSIENFNCCIAKLCETTLRKKQSWGKLGKGGATDSTWTFVPALQCTKSWRCNSNPVYKSKRIYKCHIMSRYPHNLSKWSV